VKTGRILQANIVLVSSLGLLREQFPKKRIVLATGCFDILHIGHVRFLQFASQQGDILVVGVNSDSSIKVIKGNHRPIISQEERIELIAALRCVDYVFIHENTVADEYIFSLKPDILAIGEESVKFYPSETKAAKDIGARIHIVKRIPSMSTTLILANLMSINENSDHVAPIE
jgi:rfaE bifunctional protein nucleotidyltransferase chain/domain